jgi:dihydrofolate reductase
MRKIIVLEFITLDGIIQAPGGPDEDTASGFQYGGWTAPFADAASGEIMQEEMKPADLLLGRKTFEIFAGYWPSHAEHWPGVNEVKKYVLSNTVEKPEWNNSYVLRSVEDIKKLKSSEGGDIKVWGSSELVHLLLRHDLVDELWLKIHPVVLGKGKRLFSDESAARTYTLAQSNVTPSGVIFTKYKSAGEVKTGVAGA